jgi:hypothetical protein
MEKAGYNAGLGAMDRGHRLEVRLNLYLHIGTEKTGTTSIQEFMRSNRDLLRDNGVLYPYTPGFANHTMLAMAAQSAARGNLARLFGVKDHNELAAFRSKLSKDLSEELGKSACPKVVMSNEHCSSRLVTDDAVENLRDLLADHFERIYIVVYIRRQDDFVVSSYSTAVKTGSVEPLTPPSEKLVKLRYDYWDLLSRWARVFGRGNILCRRYDKTALASGSIVDNFLDLTGIAANLPYDRPTDYNESLNAEALEFVRVANQFGVPPLNPNASEAKPDIPRRRRLLRCLAETSKGPSIDLCEDDRRALMASVRDSNRRVAMEYFGGEIQSSDDPLFGPRLDKERVSQVSLSVDRAVEFALRLWSWNAQTLDRTKKRRIHLEQAAREGRPVPRRHRALLKPSPSEHASAKAAMLDDDDDDDDDESDSVPGRNPPAW